VLTIEFVSTVRPTAKLTPTYGTRSVQMDFNVEALRIETDSKLGDKLKVEVEFDDNIRSTVRPTTKLTEFKLKVEVEFDDVGMPL
ncbi:MAG: hypothetical protein ACI8RD_007331, partial [Bacillariaceae sp.]|jgi:hypothetical protein